MISMVPVVVFGVHVDDSEIPFPTTWDVFETL